MATRRPLTQRKIALTMGEFQHGTLHSGSKEGPRVTNPKQAIAIALNQAREAGQAAPPQRLKPSMAAP